MQILPIGTSESGLSSFAQIKKSTSNMTEQSKNQNLPSVSTNIVLSQMPNISFGAKHSIEKDDLSIYDIYGPYAQPPVIEQTKYRLSVEANNAIENKDYLTAIAKKLEVAKICANQSKDRDKFMLEEGVRKIYENLPVQEQVLAKDIIREYNHSMADFIDFDIAGIKPPHYYPSTPEERFEREIKYNFGRLIDEKIKNGDFLDALTKKMQFADICDGDEAYVIKEGIIGLYEILSPHDKQTALSIIRKYDDNLAKRIVRM